MHLFANSGKIKNNFFLDIASGKNAGFMDFHRFGFNGTVPNGTFADIWAFGPTLPLYPWPTTAETFRIQSGGNAADTAAGLEAQEVTFLFLDSTGASQVETIATAGASASAGTSVTGTRLIRAFVSETGAYGVGNTGGITVENSVSNQVVAHIPAGRSTTQLSQYTVPLGCTAYLTRLHIHVHIGANKDADVAFWSRSNALTIAEPFGPKRLVRQWTGLQGSDEVKYEAYPIFPALTDLWIEASGNGATTEIDIDYDLILES